MLNQNLKKKVTSKRSKEKQGWQYCRDHVISRILDRDTLMKENQFKPSFFEVTYEVIHDMFLDIINDVPEIESKDITEAFYRINKYFKRPVENSHKIKSSNNAATKRFLRQS